MACPSYQVARPPNRQQPSRPTILVPYDRREVMSVADYAKQRGCSKPTARAEINTQGLGRKRGGRWVASRVLAAMFLDGDREAIKAYWGGDRTSDAVRPYYERLGIDPRTLGREG